MEGMIGEIRLFGGNFAPRGWAFCEGQLLPIAQNTALFSIIGTIYGGDGRTTMALPDLRGRGAIQHGNGPGLPNTRLGERKGRTTVSLTTANLPAHRHPFRASSTDGETNNPTGLFLSKAGTQVERGATAVPVDAYGPNTNVVQMSTASIGNSGGGQGFNVQNPVLAVYYIICLVGTFPSRS